MSFLQHLIIITSEDGRKKAVLLPAVSIKSLECYMWWEVNSHYCRKDVVLLAVGIEVKGTFMKTNSNTILMKMK